MPFPDLDGERVLELGNPGSMRFSLNALVLSGQKRATTGLWEIYQEESEPLEFEGERLWLVDNELQPITAVEVTRVDVRRFDQVDMDFVRAEAEGHETLEAWRKSKKAYWSATAEPEMQSSGYQGWRVKNETILVCLWFRLYQRPVSN